MSPPRPSPASIVLDTQPPSVTTVDPAINDDLVGARPTITVTFSEPIDPASWTQLGLVVQTPDGCSCSRDVHASRRPTPGPIRPSEDLVSGERVRAHGRRRARRRRQPRRADRLVGGDGSAGAARSRSRRAPALVDRGATALLTGRLTAPTRGRLAHAGGASRRCPRDRSLWVPCPSAADGSFSTRVTPSSTTEYRLRVPAAGGFGAGSAERRRLGPARRAAQLVLVGGPRRPRRQPASRSSRR